MCAVSSNCSRELKSQEKKRTPNRGVDPNLKIIFSGRTIKVSRANQLCQPGGDGMSRFQLIHNWPLSTLRIFAFVYLPIRSVKTYDHMGIGDHSSTVTLFGVILINESKDTNLDRSWRGYFTIPYLII